MNKTSRLILFSLILGLLLFLGLVFAPWIVPNIVLPAALAVWLFLRIFILSIDQKYYWWALAVGGTIWAFYRLFHSEEQAEQEEHILESDALSSWETWRMNLLFSKSESYERSRIKREMIVLLTSFYASRQHGASQAEMLHALEQRQLPLPDPFYNFLFPPEPEKPGRPSLKTALQAFSRACQRWYRRQIGQERAEFYQTIDELIEFMENSLES